MRQNPVWGSWQTEQYTAMNMRQDMGEQTPQGLPSREQVEKAIEDTGKPIDFDALIAEGKLERISANRYKLLVPPAELPPHVQSQCDAVEGTPGKPGAILTFSPRSAARDRRRGGAKGDILLFWL
jgi:hypothetical protein